MQQRRRRPDLNISVVPASKTSLPNDASPQTPPNRKSQQLPLMGSTTLKVTSSSRALKQQQQPSLTTHTAKNATSGAFLEDKTPTNLDDLLMSTTMTIGTNVLDDIGHSGVGSGSGRAASSEPRRPNPRDSHDLSLSPRNVTRDSLVTNMLLSLDQFSMGQMNTSRQTYEDLFSPADTSRTLTSRTATAGPATSGRPGHDYSYSSDFDGADNASQVSSGFSRGRRSNSSSNFQSTLGRINSLREPGTPKHHAHSRGGRGSKSSSSNSVDAGYAQVLGSQRWAHGFGGRSSSFDQGHPQGQQQQTVVANGQKPWHIDFSNSFFSANSNSADDDYEAAPTPTVPGGPRRLNTVPSMPSLPLVKSIIPPLPPAPGSGPPKSPVRGPSMERKRSTRSSRSATVGRMAQSSSSRAPPLPVPGGVGATAAFDIDSAPAPHVGYEKSKEPVHVVGGSPHPSSSSHQTGHGQHQPQKEKVGFFRRVFGTWKDLGSSSPSSDPSASARNVASTSHSDSMSPRGHSAGGTKPQSAPPSRDSQHSSHANAQQQSHYPTLQKKTSSFFRRQKKAAQQEPPPPPPPLPPSLIVPPTIVPHRIPSPQQAEWSPALARALAPYLGDGGGGSSGGPSPTKDSAMAEASDSAPANPPDSAVREGPRERELDSSGSTHPAAGLASAVRGIADDNPAEPRPEPEPEREPRQPLQKHFEPKPKPHPRDYSPVNTNANRIEKPPSRQAPEPPHHSNSIAPPLTNNSSAAARTGSFLNDNSDSEAEEAEDRSRPNPNDAKSRSSRVQKKNRPKESSKLVLPMEGAVLENGRGSPSVASKSASSLPSVKVEDSEPSSATVSSRMAADAAAAAASSPPVPSSSSNADKPIDEPDFVVGEPTEDERQKAQKIYEGNEDYVTKERAAAWMGEEGPVRQRTLSAYMALHDFASRSILSSLRELCGRLILRAETQQVDRILSAFAKRWCECNPNHGFKATDVVHTICYSIMLLNTDLHLADIEQKMTRSQFVKNTIGTIRQSLADAAPDAFGRQSILPGKGVGGLSPDDGGRISVDERPTNNNFRNSFLAGFSSAAASASKDQHHDSDDPCGPLVNTPFEGTLRAWEGQVETVLKDTYTSIRDERLPLFGASANDPQHHLHSQTSLSVIGLLKRSPSVLSKAPSEGQASMRGRNADQSSSRVAATLRWTSKSRSRARAQFPPSSSSNGNGNGNGPSGGGFSSSRTSFDDGGSIWSPTVSSATRSRYSLGRTQTSMSIDSMGSAAYPPNANFQQSIGFANALSQAIVREEATMGAGGGSVLSLSSTTACGGGQDGAGSVANVNANASNTQPQPLLEDESLELAGPPWVKEGRVIHKHHLDGIDKKAKDRNWTEVFAVIQKGSMSLFSFAPNKSLGKKSRGHLHHHHGHAGGLGGLGGGANSKGGGGGAAVVVGGGNWQENATNLGTFSLKQTLASALPPPGYSTSRPHVWALSLPTGAVHLFQVGTPEVSREFVTTANYWSARLSTHPLVGGVSNMEYGWSENIVNNPLVTAIADATGGTGGTGGASGPGSRPGTGGGPSGTVPRHQSRGSLHSRASSFRSGSLEFMRTRSGSMQSADRAIAAVTEGVASGAAAPGSSHGPSSSSGTPAGHNKLPGDKVHIAEWRPPAQSLRPSTLAEADQLSGLMAYVASIEEDLRAHNALRSPMLLAFSPRGGNAGKAMGNWQRKSEYLLRESVKYRTYVDALHEGAARREEVYGERMG